MNKIEISSFNVLPSDDFRRNFTTHHPRKGSLQRSFRAGEEFFRITQWRGKPSEWYSRRGIEIIGNIINPKEGELEGGVGKEERLPLGINL